MGAIQKNQKKLALFLGFFILAFAILFPSLTLAQQPLVPCGLEANLADQCQLCHLVELVQRVINFIIVYLAAPFATLLIAWAGINLMVFADNEGKRKEAKQLLKDILVGFLFILLAWTIVIVIMNMLVNDTIKTPGSSWFEIKCAPGYGAPNLGLDQFQGGDISSIPNRTLPEDVFKKEVQTRQTLLDGGVQVNRVRACGGSVTTQCTSVSGLNQGVVDYAISTRAAVCGTDKTCGLVITGGAEAGHSGTGTGTHAGGDKIDLRLAPKLDSYVIKNFSTCDKCIRSDGAKLYTDPTTKSVWAREGDHWDVQVKKI